MADCFQNIVSFKNRCNAVEPKSGIYTDILGLHKSEIEAYIQAPYNSAEDFFADMYEAAIKDIETKIHSKFMPKYKAKSILSNERIGLLHDNMQTNDSEVGKLRGVEIEVCNENSPLDFTVSELSLFVDMSTTVSVFVYDLLQNKLIDTITVDTVANELTTVYPHKTYKATRNKLNIAFIYDVSVLDQYQVNVNNYGCSSCTIQRTYSRANGWINTRGVEFNSLDTKILSNVNPISHTAGLSIVYSLNCNQRDWICSQIGSLAMPLAHKICSTILNYGLLNSNRKNNKTISDRDTIDERIKQHEFNYTQGMDNIIMNMRPPTDKLCFECYERVKFVDTFG